MEEIFKNPVFNFALTGVVFFAQLYLRTIMAQIMRDRDRADTHIKELYTRTDKIPALETDLRNLRDECARKHRR